MSKFLLGLNIVLLLGLAYLYYAFYNSNKAVKTATVANKHDTTDSNFKIAYFDIDSIDKNYAFAIETRNYLKSRYDAMEGKLNKIKQDYMAKVNDYNKRGATLSQTEQSQMQEDLARLDNSYSQQQQTLSQDYQGEYMQKMLELKNKIQAYLKNYSAQRGYVYVFATSGDDNVIYYKDSLRNITSEIVKQLNEEYAASKKNNIFFIKN